MPEQTPDSQTLDSRPHGGADTFTGLLKTGIVGKPAIVLMHGRNSHPDGPVVSLLRKKLNGIGHTTLSIPNPLPKIGDEFADYLKDQGGENYVFPEACARILSAIAFLKTRDATSIVLLGFSMGARIHSHFLASNQSSQHPIKGFVALSIGVNGTGPLNSTTTLGKVAVPVLDVSGAGDADVANSMPARKAAYGSGRGSSYESVVLDGPVPHNFAGAEERLEKAVKTWLDKISGV